MKARELGSGCSCLPQFAVGGDSCRLLAEQHSESTGGVCVCEGGQSGPSSKHLPPGPPNRLNHDCVGFIQILLCEKDLSVNDEPERK